MSHSLFEVALRAMTTKPEAGLHQIHQGQPLLLTIAGSGSDEEKACKVIPRRLVPRLSLRILLYRFSFVKTFRLYSNAILSDKFSLVPDDFNDAATLRTPMIVQYQDRCVWRRCSHIGFSRVMMTVKKAKSRSCEHATALERRSVFSQRSQVRKSS